MVIIIYKGLKKGESLNFLFEIGQEMENIMEKINNNMNLDSLKNIEEYTIDRFEGEIAILENRKTKEFIEIDKNKLPNNIKEGMILQKVNDNFIINNTLNEEISKRIENKMNNLWE